MSGNNIQSYLEKVKNQSDIFLSYGTTPYTIHIFKAKDISQKITLANEISYCIAIYNWKDFDEKDFIDFVSNTYEGLNLEEAQIQDYIDFMRDKYLKKDINMWKIKQSAMVLGYLIGLLKKNKNIQFVEVNPSELSSFDQALDIGEGLETFSMIWIYENIV